MLRGNTIKANKQPQSTTPRASYNALWVRLTSHAPLLLVLLIYVALAVAHSRVAPLSIGNDEWAHFLYARFIAEHGRLPVNLAERENKDEAGTKSDDPPLYHLLAAGVNSAVNPQPERLLRPVNGLPRRQLADNTVVSFAFLVHNGYELPPFRGEVLLWHVGRALSIIFGAGIIVLTYITSLTLFPNRRKQALLAAALLAFMPAFIFHNSVMTYDGLGAVLTALFLLAAIRAIKQPARWRWWLALGLLGGLAVTTKYTSVLLPLEILFVAGLGWWKVSGFRFQVSGFRFQVAGSTSHATRNTQHAIQLNQLFPRILIAGLAMLLASSWWFGWIVYHFNTIEAKGPVVGVLEPLLVRGGNDSTAISVSAYLFGEESLSIDAPPPARERNYPQLIGVMAASFWSAVIAEAFPSWAVWLTGLFVAAMLLSAAGLWRVWRSAGRSAKIWLLLLLLFHTLLITPLVLIRLFISFDPLEAVQGRHILFPAASAIPVLLVWGWRQWHPKLGPALVALLLVWSAAGQLGWSALAYPPPLPVWANTAPQPETAAVDSPIDTPVEALRLVGVNRQPTPGASSLQVDLWWQAQAWMSQDYLIALSLRDEAGQVAGYTAGQPVQGRYPTRSWEPGDVVRDTHWLPLVGLTGSAYQLELQLLNRQGAPLGDPLALGPVSLPQQRQPVDPCAIWFGGRANHGGPLIQPYRQRASFTVITPEPPRLAPLSAGAGQPQESPFISVGKFHVFMVGPDWADTYQLVVGEQECHTLAVDLPLRYFTPPEIPDPLVANFNGEIELLGYELPTRRIEPGQRLPLALYWRALTYMGQDYHIFDNLLDSQQRRWGGYDRRAQDGYSTLLWTPGQVITDPFGVPVDPDAPPAVYTLDLGWYQKTGSGPASLPLLGDNGQPTGQHSLRLGPIKVGGPPPEVVTNNPDPQVELNQPFGPAGEITLLGYTLTDETGQRLKNPKARRSPKGGKIQNLKLTLYWQVNAPLAADYTTFFHLRDASNQNVTQKDSPPASGRYPTSLWDPGEIIVDQMMLPVAQVPPGEYTPVVGLYNFATGNRLPVAEIPENELRLESVTLP